MQNIKGHGEPLILILGILENIVGLNFRTVHAGICFIKCHIDCLVGSHLEKGQGQRQLLGGQHLARPWDHRAGVMEREHERDIRKEMKGRW